MRETDVGCPYRVLFKIWLKDLEFRDDLLGSCVRQTLGALIRFEGAEPKERLFPLIPQAGRTTGLSNRNVTP